MQRDVMRRHRSGEYKLITGAIFSLIPALEGILFRNTGRTIRRIAYIRNALFEELRNRVYLSTIIEEINIICITLVIKF